jgi:hypothetical protein
MSNQIELIPVWHGSPYLWTPENGIRYVNLWEVFFRLIEDKRLYSSWLQTSTGQNLYQYRLMVLQRFYRNEFDSSFRPTIKPPRGMTPWVDFEAELWGNLRANAYSSRENMCQIIIVPSSFKPFGFNSCFCRGVLT